MEITSEEITRQIEERKKNGEIFFEGEEEFNGVKEDQLFYITEEGQLVVVFGLYEIAPYAAGILEFPIVAIELINSCSFFETVFVVFNSFDIFVYF